MYVLLGASARALGFGVWQMRFLPVVLGAVTIALCFNLGRRWMGGAAGALAAAAARFLALDAGWSDRRGQRHPALRCGSDRAI